MRKFFSLIAAVLFAGSMMAADATMTAGTNGSAAEVNGNAAIKVGTSKAGGDMTITVGEGATSLTFYAAAWNNVTGLSLNITAPDGVTVTPASVDLKMDPGISNNSPFTLTGDEENFKFEFVLAGVEAETTLKLEGSAAKRFVVWGATYETGEVPPTPADTYTVAGAPEAIFGSYWDPTDTNNDMKKVAGIYTWEKADLNLAVGIIEFKVVKNHSWDVAYPSSNYEVSIAEEGEYTLTITFDPATETVAAEAVKKEALPDPTNCAEAREAALSVSANNELYNDGKEYTIEGYVTSIAYAWASGSMSFWMADAADGGNVLEAYKCAIENEEDAVRVGDKVAVTGKLTKYNTTPEFAAGCTVVIIERAEVIEPKNLGEKTIAEFLELKNKVDTCILTGTVANVKNTEYGNFDLVELGNAEVSVYVYGLLTAAGEAKKCFAEENIAEGDTLKVLAIYSEYNAAPQVKNAIFVEVKHAANPEPQIIELDVEYAEALYIASQEYWQINLFKDYNYETQEVTYPDFYIGVAPKSPTAIAGTYSVEEEIYFIEVDFEDAEINAEEATDFIVTYLGEGMYHYELEFVGEDGNIYILDAILETYAYDYDNDYAVIELTDEVEPQNINNTKAVVKSAKLIKNGQLLIEKDGKTYNAAGQLLK